MKVRHDGTVEVDRECEYGYTRVQFVFEDGVIDYNYIDEKLKALDEYFKEHGRGRGH